MKRAVQYNAEEHKNPFIEKYNFGRHKEKLGEE
jgi:hypothetical protein